MAWKKSFSISLIAPALLLATLSANAETIQYSTSFDCKKAASQIEKTICESKPLADADVELGLIYKNLISNLDPRDKRLLKKEQIEWLKKRNTSCPSSSNVACIQALYAQRIEALKKWKQSTKDVSSGTISDSEDRPRITLFNRGTKIVQSIDEAKSDINVDSNTSSVKDSFSFAGYSKATSFLTLLYQGENYLESRDVIRIWKQSGHIFELLGEVMAPEISAVCSFEESNYFKIKNRLFIDVPLIYSGTGHFRTDTILTFTPENELRVVEFEDAGEWLSPLMKNDEAPDGGTHNWFETDNMRFEVLVADYSGSFRKPLYWVRGTYKLIEMKEKSGNHYKITVDKYNREPFE